MKTFSALALVTAAAVIAYKTNFEAVAAVLVTLEIIAVAMVDCFRQRLPLRASPALASAR